MRKDWIHFLWLLVLIVPAGLKAQVTGGRSVFAGLTLENSPRIMALGGISQANPSKDISLGLQNPALTDSLLDEHLSFNFLDYYSQSQMYFANYGRYNKKLKTFFSTGFSFNNYGKLDQTDNLGNVLSVFSALDYQFYLNASRYYKSNWRYGANFKIAGSDYAGNTSLGLLLDLGVYRMDTARRLSYGMSFKNIGFQIKRFKSSTAEPMPFDLQFGLSKRFAHLPFRFNITAHHLYAWNIRYDNPADRRESVFIGNDNTNDDKSYFFDKLFRHLTFAGELLLSDKLSFTASYNHLRRSELGLYQQSGLSGFAFGMNLHYKKWEFSYAKNFYNQVGSTNFLGLNLYLHNF